MALTVVRPYGNSSNNGFLRRPVQRSKSNASTYSTAWSSTTDRKVLRREICCRAELNASAESSSAISASLRIDFDMRQTVSLPPSPNLRDSRRKPVDWVFASDGPSPPLFLSDCLPLSTSVTSSSYASSSSSDRRVISLLQRSPSDEENLSSGYASCESTPGTASVESNDFLFPSTTVFIDKTVMTPRPRSTSLNVFPALGSATSSTEDVTAFATLAAGDDDVRRRRWGSSSSNASSASTSSSAGSGPASRSGSPARRNNNDGGGAFLLRTVAFFVSALVLVYRKFEAVAGVRSTVFRAVVGLLKMLRPTILQRLSSGSSFSSFEEDLGFGLDEDSDDGDSGAAAAAGDRMYHERQRRQRRAEKLDAAEDLG